MHYVFQKKKRKVMVTDFIDSVLIIDDKEDVATHAEVLKNVKDRASQLVSYLPFNSLIREFSGLRAVSDTDDFIIEDNAEKLTLKFNEVYSHYDEFNEKFAKVKAESARFDINNVAQKYLDAYESLLDQKAHVA